MRTLIVDAYNFIFEGSKSIGNIEVARNNFIEFMGDFNARNSDFDEIILVFDGQVKQISGQLGMTIIFSERKKSADQAIENIIVAAESKQNVVLITNDNVSKNMAIGFGAKTFSTHWLRSKFDDILESETLLNREPFKNVVAENIDPAVRDKLNKMIGRFSGNDET